MTDILSVIGFFMALHALKNYKIETYVKLKLTRGSDTVISIVVDLL